MHVRCSRSCKNIKLLLLLITLTNIKLILGQSFTQEVAIWAWTKDSDLPLLRRDILTNENQYLIRFDPGKQSEFSTTGPKTVCFWTWEELNLEGYIGKVSKTDFGHYTGKFTSTIFLTGTETALSSTDDGYVIVWETQYATVLLDDPADRLMRTASKVRKGLSPIEYRLRTLIYYIHTYK